MAVNFHALNQVYNHYMTTYAPKTNSSLDTHKKSELRNVYNSIVKLNKESPLYLLDNSKETKAYAIDLKENARMLRHTLLSLGTKENLNLLNKKVAFSSNEGLASASFIEEVTSTEDLPSFSLEVKQLAQPQVNMGKFLPSTEATGLNADTYSFDISINDLSYEFQFAVGDTDTNLDIQNKICRLITNSNIGLTAETLEDGEGNSALQISSVRTGIDDDEKYIFSVTDKYSSKTTGIVEHLGINEITRQASNALFSVNGSERTSYANHFTVDKIYEIHLNGISKNEDDIATIGSKDDVESLKTNIHTLISGYNDFIRSASEYTGKHQKGRQLLSEMNHITNLYQTQFSSLGIMRQTDGTFAIDEDTLNKTALEDEIAERFSSVKDFTGSVLRKANQISLNPMQYVEKRIVAYKNPDVPHYATPYITSAYSGMLFNSYC